MAIGQTAIKAIVAKGQVGNRIGHRSIEDLNGKTTSVKTIGIQGVLDTNKNLLRVGSIGKGHADWAVATVGIGLRAEV